MTGHTGYHHTGSAWLDDVAEHFQSQRDAQQIHGQNVFGRGLFGRQPSSVNHCRQAAGRGGQAGEFGHRLPGCDIDMARHDVMTVVGQLLGQTVDLCGVHIAEYDDASCTHPACYGKAHTADPDDREDLGVAEPFNC